MLCSMRGGQTDHKRVEELKATLRMKLEGYERILNKHRYLAGDVCSSHLHLVNADWLAGSQEITLVDLFHLPYGTMVTEVHTLPWPVTLPNQNLLFSYSS